MNLQSNALKFTKDNGSIKIIAEYVQAQTTAKFKTPEYFEEFSDASDGNSDEEDQDAKNQSRNQHSIEAVFAPDPQHDKLVISVIDTGIGIKKSETAKLFKLFGTINTTRQMNTQGIGLGLVISENIVKTFGGVIGVRTKYQKGSKFAFSILLKSDDV